MVIHGLQKLTLVDFPSVVASIVFTGSCNFRCPFCHNSSLVLNPSSQPIIPEPELFDFLKQRLGFLEGVVVTGGEPTLQKDLIPFLLKIKQLGYKVKLDTNGYRPDTLNDAIESGAVDYVAMDIKNSLDMYPKTAGLVFFTPENIEKSVSLLLENRVKYEFRTTVVKELHSKENFEKIGSWVKGCENYYLQSFIQSANTIEKGFSSPSIEELETYAKTLRTYIKNVQVRDL